MIINILYDSRKSERYDQLMQELNRQEIYECVIWPCLLSKTVIESINLSHKMIVLNAKEKGEPECCIAEHDLCFPSADGWQYFIRNKPDDFDIYSGGTYGIGRPVVNPIKAMSGIHLYIIHQRFYDTFLSTPSNKHIDQALDGLGKYIVCYPFAAIQRKGWSANNMKEVDYNVDLKPEDVYGGIPDFTSPIK